MIHYSCDLCGKKIGKERFEVQVEIAPAFDPEELTEEDLDVDHLEQIVEELSSLETTNDFDFEDSAPRSFSYDLCRRCAKRFVKAPLQPVSPPRVTYSEN